MYEVMTSEIPWRAERRVHPVHVTKNLQIVIKNIMLLASSSDIPIRGISFFL